MISKLTSVFDDMSTIQYVARHVGFPAYVVDNLPFITKVFVLSVLVSFIMKIILAVVFRVDFKEMRDDADLILDSTGLFFGYIGGCLCDVGIVIGLLVMRNFNVDFSFLAESGSMIEKLILIVLNLFELVFECAFFVPFVLLFINNIRVYKLWGPFQTVITVFIGLSIFLIIAGAFIVGIIQVLPFMLYMALYMICLSGIVSLIIRILGGS